MIIVSIVAFCVAILLLLEVVVRKSDFFSPARLYLFFHALTLGIAFLGLHPAMTAFRPLTSLVYFGSGACFLLGTWIPGMMGGKPLPTLAPKGGMSRYNWNWHWVFAIVICAIFVWGMLISYRGAGSFPLLAENKARVADRFFKVRWTASIALGFGGLAMAMFFMTMFRTRVKSKPILLRLGLWMTIFSGILFSMALSRVGVIFFALFALVYYNHGVRRLSISKLFLFFVCIFGFFVTFAYFKLNDLEKTHSIKLEKSEIVTVLMKVPYAYVANNYWNLDYALNPENSRERHPPTYGFTIVAGILDMMALPGGHLGVEIRQARGYDGMFHERSIKVHGLNTMGYQWGLYKDFGIPGVLLVPFLSGILIALLYRRVRQQVTPLNLAVYSYITFFIAFSWFTAMWELVGSLWGLFYLAAACYFSQRTALRSSGFPSSLPSPADRLGAKF